MPIVLALYYFPCSFSLSFSFPAPPLHLKYWKSCLKRSRCLQFFGLVFSECSKSTVMLAVRSVLFLNCQLQLSKFREASCLFQYSTLPSSFQGVGKRLSPPTPPRRYVCSQELKSSYFGNQCYSKPGCAGITICSEETPAGREGA